MTETGNIIALAIAALCALVNVRVAGGSVKRLYRIWGIGNLLPFVACVVVFLYLATLSKSQESSEVGLLYILTVAITVSTLLLAGKRFRRQQ